MSKSDYEAAATNVAELLTQVESAIKELLLNPRNWWQNRKRYSRLSENIAKGYVLSKLRDVRMRGRGEADKFIDKMIFGKKPEVPSEILAFMQKNRGVWADFIFKVAAALDPEALTGFFVPLVYGGVISRKNMSGEAFGIVEFGENDSKTPQSERIMRAIRAIDSFKRQGISIILIAGVANTIYSKQMLSMYRNSPNEAFIIVERESEKDGAMLESGKSAYDRTVLIELCAAKNVLVLLDSKDSYQANGVSSRGARTAGKSRALSSYGILHGVWSNFADRSSIIDDKSSQNYGKSGNLSANSSEISGKGSCFITFDRGSTLKASVNGLLKIPKRTEEAIKPMMSAENTIKLVTSTEDVIKLIPRPVVDFLASPTLPIRLPDLYELIIISQFILTAGKIRNIRKEIV